MRRVVILSDGETWDYEENCEFVEIPDDHEVVEVRDFQVISAPVRDDEDVGC